MLQDLGCQVAQLLDVVGAVTTRDGRREWFEGQRWCWRWRRRCLHCDHIMRWWQLLQQLKQTC